MYIQTPVKLLPHLFLRKMDWLSLAYLASFIQHVSIFILCRRWHMAKNRIKSVPDRWERAKSGKRVSPAAIIWFWITICAPKQKRANFSKQPAASLYQKMSPGSWCELQLGSDLFSISVWLNLMAFRGMTVKSKVLKWHLSSRPACFCSGSDRSEFRGHLLWEHAKQNLGSCYTGWGSCPWKSGCKCVAHM